MTKSETICAYLEGMAAKVGGDVQVFPRDKGKFIMHRRGRPDKCFEVSMEEKRESFDRKVKILMEE